MEETLKWSHENRCYEQPQQNKCHFLLLMCLLSSKDGLVASKYEYIEIERVNPEQIVIITHRD